MSNKASKSHNHTIGQISDLHVGSYVYNYPGTVYNTFTFTDSNAKGFSYIIAAYQDSGFDHSITAILNYSTGAITINIGNSCSKTTRVSYLCFK